MSGIEFIDPEPDAGPDEALDTGPRRRGRGASPSHTASARTTLVVRTVAGAVLAVVAGLILVGYLQHDDGGGAAAPSDATTRVSFGPEPPSTSARPARAVIDDTCPVVDACTVVSALPAAVTGALRARLPGVTDVAGTSVLVAGPRPTLRTRRVTARDGSLVLAVEIHPATRYDHARSAALSTGGRRLVYARVLTRGLAVTVSVTGPPGRAPGAATVRSLARDARLLAVA